MPDLTLHTAFTCKSNEYFKVEVVGSKGDRYDVVWRVTSQASAGSIFDWTCSCPGFKWRGKCRHIKEVKISEKRCGWNPCLEIGPEPDHVDGKWSCPECGEEALAYQVGV